MSVSLTARYLGNNKLELTHGPSGATLVTVPPLDNQGDGSSFSPTDLCAASLGACLLTTISLYAGRHNITLAGSYVAMQKLMNREPRRVAEIVVNVHLPSSLSEEQREVLQRVGATCPVARSLSADVLQSVTYYYDVTAPSI